jgi:hypothetical protein
MQKFVEYSAVDGVGNYPPPEIQKIEKIIKILFIVKIEGKIFKNPNGPS